MDVLEGHAAAPALATPHESTRADALKILIVAEHASSKFGGEASLPLHYFRVLHRRGLPVWLVTHARVRDELGALFGTDHPRICYVDDTRLHQWLCRAGSVLPDRLSYITTGFVMRVTSQLAQRRIARELVKQHGIDVIHQPMPVSPKEPSLMHGMGAPVVIGPLNGGMDYPAAFQTAKVRRLSRLADAGRAMSRLLNRLMPGKPRAAAVLVANERSRAALPEGLGGRIVLLPENGVDLSLWGNGSPPAKALAPSAPAHFVFMGRLVDWKAVDLLLHAFKQAAAQAPMSLTVIGDGIEGAALRSLADALGVRATSPGEPGRVHFAGWQSQSACAEQLSASDALVLPSLWECGGAVVLEAMACRLPVLATAWGGPLDYLDEHCGILVAPQSRESFVADMAEGLVRLARSAELRQRLGEVGRRRIETHFDWERKVDTMIQLYRLVVADARAAARGNAGTIQ